MLIFFLRKKKREFLVILFDKKRKKETRIIKKVFLVILSIKRVKDNLGAHTPVIQEPENMQENRGLELFMVAMASVIFALQEVILDSLPLKLYF